MSLSKKNSFFPMSPVPSALMCGTVAVPTADKPGPPAKGAFSSEEDEGKQKGQREASRVVEEFFWIGSSIIAFSKWRLGYMGKTHCGAHCSCESPEKPHKYGGNRICLLLLSWQWFQI